MAKKKKQPEKTFSESQSAPIISPEVGNYEKHPFFIKKVNEAKALLEKFGLPKAVGKKFS